MPQIGIIIQSTLMTLFVVNVMHTPLSNFVLALSPKTRLALNDKNLGAIRWYVVPMSLAIASCGLWIIRNPAVYFPVMGYGWAAVTNLAYESCQSDNRSVRRKMIAITLLCVMVVCWAFSARSLVIRPKFRQLLPQIAELGSAEDSDEKASILNDLREQTAAVSKFNYRYVALPILGAFLLGCYADDVRIFLWRHAAHDK